MRRAKERTGLSPHRIIVTPERLTKDGVSANEAHHMVTVAVATVFLVPLCTAGICLLRSVSLANIAVFGSNEAIGAGMTTRSFI